MLLHSFESHNRFSWFSDSCTCQSFERLQGSQPQDSARNLSGSSGPFPSNMENVSEYIVKPCDFEILQRKDGEDWLLGQGAFGKVRCVTACVLLARGRSFNVVGMRRPQGRDQAQRQICIVGVGAELAPAVCVCGEAVIDGKTYGRRLACGCASAPGVAWSWSTP